MADVLSDVCARTHRVDGLLPRLAAAGGRLAWGLAAGGIWGSQERWSLAKRRPFHRPNLFTKKGQPFNYAGLAIDDADVRRLQLQT